MKIRVLCVGRIKEEFYRKRIMEYHSMISKQCDFEIIEVADEKTAEGMSEAERDRLLDIEGNRLLKYLDRNPRELVAALCIEGKMYDSAAWRELLQKQTEARELCRITYIIGGSMGLSPKVVQRADQRLSFSRLTFPHQLMRVVLLEQIACHYL